MRATCPACGKPNWAMGGGDRYECQHCHSTFTRHTASTLGDVEADLDKTMVKVANLGQRADTFDSNVITLDARITGIERDIRGIWKRLTKGKL